MFTWILLITQAAISSGGLLMLRHSMPQILDRTTSTPFSAWVWGFLGVLFYGTSFILWLYILSRHPVSFAYPLTIGLTLALTVIGSAVILHERVSGLQIVGIILMAVAAVFLTWGTAGGMVGPADADAASADP